METLDRTPLPEDDPDQQDVQFGHAMQHAGLSVTLTSMSSVIAFSIGSAADLPGISAFCFFSALCFFANYGMYSRFYISFACFVPFVSSLGSAEFIKLLLCIFSMFCVISWLCWVLCFVECFG